MKGCTICYGHWSALELVAVYLAVTVMAMAGGVGPEALLSIVHPGRALAGKEEEKSSGHPLT